MQAELKIAGLDEVIKEVVDKAVRQAVKDVIELILREFKREIIAETQDEVLKKQIWTKQDIMIFTDRSKSWVNNLPKNYKDFPKKKTQTDNDKAYWERDELLAFFARHPEIPTTAYKYVKGKQ